MTTTDVVILDHALPRLAASSLFLLQVHTKGPCDYIRNATATKPMRAPLLVIVIFSQTQNRQLEFGTGVEQACWQELTSCRVGVLAAAKPEPLAQAHKDGGLARPYQCIGRARHQYMLPPDLGR